jgi:3alpha(or 20beta)-hydroxysteroid dehydrogenase
VSSQLSAYKGSSEGRLEGAIAIITGAARGIGASITRRFVEEGAAVLATDIRDREGERLAAALSKRGKVVYARLDVTREDDWAKAIQVCCEELGCPTILVNNAGIVRVSGLMDESLDGWRGVIDADLTGAFLGMKAVIPLMREAQSGSIINMSSIAGLVACGEPAPAAYYAAKGGLAALTRCAAVSYAGDGIRVNSIHPGAVQTDMLNQAESASFVVSRTPLGRAATPNEIADAAVYLASQESSYITGVQFPIDGGYAAQ